MTRRREGISIQRICNWGLVRKDDGMIKKFLFVYIVFAMTTLMACGGNVTNVTANTAESSLATIQLDETNASTAADTTVKAEYDPEFGSAGYFEKLLNKEMYRSEHDWYNMALTSYYETPAQLDLGLFFYNGFPWLEEPSLTEEEMAYLKVQPAFLTDLPVDRFSTAQVNDVLIHYFGITLEQTEKKGIEDYVYYDKLDTYYHSHSDALLVQDITVTDVDVREDGSYVIYYTPDDISYGQGIAVMLPTDGGWRFISNQPDY